MELTLHRLWLAPDCITGIIYADGIQRWFSLELPRTYDNRENVPSHTCIPPGKYKLAIMFSPKFDREMPHVMDVPGRSSIEIHPGNFPSDILGCILVGMKRLAASEIGESVAAFKELMDALTEAQSRGEESQITIS